MKLIQPLMVWTILAGVLTLASFVDILKSDFSTRGWVYKSRGEAIVFTLGYFGMFCWSVLWL